MGDHYEPFDGRRQDVGGTNGAAFSNGRVTNVPKEPSCDTVAGIRIHRRPWLVSRLHPFSCSAGATEMRYVRGSSAWRPGSTYDVFAPTGGRATSHNLVVCLYVINFWR